jgi:hypothetical protein
VVVARVVDRREISGSATTLENFRDLPAGSRIASRGGGKPVAAFIRNLPAVMALAKGGVGGFGEGRKEIGAGS